MNYEKVIVELLSRIKDLEEAVAALQERVETMENATEKGKSQATTGEIRQYILNKIAAARDAGRESITIRASDIHRELKLVSRFPMVCNAMRQCMKANDEVLFETPSGYSSSLEIKYYLG